MFWWCLVLKIVFLIDWLKLLVWVLFCLCVWVLGVLVCCIVFCVCWVSSLVVDLWLMVVLQWLFIGLLVCIWVCLVLVMVFMWQCGGVIRVCCMGEGMFLFCNVEISVLLVLSLVSVVVILSLGLGMKVLVVIFIVFWLCGVKVCSVCCMWLLSCLRMLVGMLLGNCEQKYMFMFLEWISCIICLICCISVGGVLLNSRCVLLKMKISLGLFRLFIFGSVLNSFDSSYSRNVEYSCGLSIDWLVVRMLIMLWLL